MSEQIYQNVYDRLVFFKDAFNDIEAAISKSIYKNPSQDIRNFENFDSMIPLVEIDLFKKNFPDTYLEYFRSFHNQYIRISKMIKKEIDNVEIMKKIDRDNNLHVKDRRFIWTDLILWKLDYSVENVITHFEKLGVFENGETIVLEDYVFPVKLDSQKPIEEIIKHTEEITMTEDINKTEIQEIPEQISTPKGKSRLTREQVALLFFYLREKQLIAQPTNGNVAKAIQILTGHSAKQIQDILKSSGTPVYQLGKDNDKINRHDLLTIISELETLIEIIQNDFKTYSDNNELK